MARNVAPLVAALVVSACANGAKPPAAERARSSASTASNASTASTADGGAPLTPVASASASPSTEVLPGLPLPVSPKPGPLRVDGYPSRVDAANSDPASPFGFTRDGSQFAYCMFDACCAEDMSRCTLTDASGKVTTLENTTSYAYLEGPAKAAARRMTNEELRAFTRDERLLALGPNTEAGGRLPPAPTGTWAFGGDMTLVVRAIAPTEGKGPDDEGHVPGSVKIGARIEGEREVFVVFPRPDFCVKFPQACYEAYLNGLALSPDGRDLGFLVFVRNPSHGSSFAAVRMPATAFAARVFNDTGMLHHTKKEWKRAGELFLRAVHADPTQERFAYNLACALAREKDARAEVALQHAVARGGDAVRTRARKDADFEAVRAEPWFERALR